MHLKIGLDIINGCIANDRRAQKSLYQISLPYLNAVALRYLPESAMRQDALQNAFVSIFKNLKSYDPGKGSFKTWAVRILINCCLKSLRSSKRHNIVQLSELNAGVSDSFTGLDNLSDKEIISFLKRMPEDQYIVFNMHCFEGYAHGEIADALGITSNLSRQRLSRARKWLLDNSASSGVEVLAQRAHRKLKGT